MIFNRHLCGMDRRSFHFSKAFSPTPSERPTDLIVSQSRFEMVIMGWEYFYGLSESQPLFGGLPKSLESG
jgi:hypothetical protein